MKNLNRSFFICLLVLSSVLFLQKNSFSLVYPYSGTYSGAQEVPPAITPATGTINGTFDDVTKVITVSVAFSGLLGPTTAAHFHAPAPAGVNAGVTISFIPTGFPLGVTSGTYSQNFVLTPAQETNFLAGLFYANIHTTNFPGGELRSQIIPDAPLPVELASFTSVILRNAVTLNWSTVSERNNAGFDIERTSVNSEWSKVGYVSGNGNTVSPVNYSFTDRGLNTGAFNYRLKQIDFNGNSEYFNLSNEVNIGIPAAYFLSQNYPNPFNPSTKISYDLPVDGKVNIVLYDISGKEVAALVNEVKSAGYYSVNFNASNISSGIYFYRISSGSFTAIKKMMLVK